jgi:hypothetical protein
VKLAEGHHLRDDQMIAAYVGADTRPRKADITLEHLRSCPECSRRFGALVDQLAELRQAAADEADAVFTSVRLEEQRAQILNHLEHVGHPARVIQFPARNTQSLSIFTGNQVRRWIAAAAAAGLIIGLTVGRMTDFRGGSQAGRTAVTAGPSTAGSGSHAQPPRYTRPTAEPVRPNDPTDDEMLSTIERPLYLQPVAGELEYLDAMTPRPTQVALRLR